MSEAQELHDRFYFEHGPCCAGCDWWRSINAVIGECLQSKIISGEERAAAIGIEKCSRLIPAGHAVTERGHVCGRFKDDFDWSSRAYRRSGEAIYIGAGPNGDPARRAPVNFASRRAALCAVPAVAAGVAIYEWWRLLGWVIGL